MHFIFIRPWNSLSVIQAMKNIFHFWIITVCLEKLKLKAKRVQKLSESNNHHEFQSLHCYFPSRKCNLYTSLKKATSTSTGTHWHQAGIITQSQKRLSTYTDDLIHFPSWFYWFDFQLPHHYRKSQVRHCSCWCKWDACWASHHILSLVSVSLSIYRWAKWNTKLLIQSFLDPSQF